MSSRTVVASVALGLLVGCGPTGGEPEPTGAHVGVPMPSAASFEGWTAAEGPIAYVPDTLYEYLDGGAERYLGYGFRRLDHARYQLGDDPLASVTLDVYDMGNELGAFGIFRSVRAPDAELRPWCSEGYHAATVTSAWRGNVYVHCSADDDRPELIAMAERLVELVCDAIPGEASLPAILEPLPPDGLVPSSERYVASDLLGHSFLPGGVVASYELDGLGAEVFFSDLGAEAAAADAMAALREHHARWSEIVGEAPEIGDGGFTCTNPALGSVTVVRAGRFVAGVHGELAGDVQDRLLQRLVDRLVTI
jgi:hypothetical protein